MEFERLLKRASLGGISDYLYSGGGYECEAHEKGFNECLREAEKKAFKLFEKYFSDSDALEEFSNMFYEQIEIYKNVYFQMGLLTGAKMGIEIYKKAEEL